RLVDGNYLVCPGDPLAGVGLRFQRGGFYQYEIELCLQRCQSPGNGLSVGDLRQGDVRSAVEQQHQAIGARRGQGGAGNEVFQVSGLVAGIDRVGLLVIRINQEDFLVGGQKGAGQTPCKKRFPDSGMQTSDQNGFSGE